MSLPAEYDDDEDPGAVHAAKRAMGRNDFRYRDVRVGRRVTFLSP
jgi:hypothetical protein